jgi:hypothetical protein
MKDPVKHDASLGVAVFIRPKYDDCRIFIAIYSDSKGILENGKEYIPDHQCPAHARVYTANRNFIGRLNITGPRPVKPDDVIEYLKSKRSRIDNYLEDIVEVVNRYRIKDDGSKQYA